MPKIELTQGLFATVDDLDFEKINQFKWCCRRNGKHCYAAAIVSLNPKKVELMHRFILGLNDRRVFVDHIDSDGLNNSRSNIRIASNQENQQNVGLNKTNKTGFRGVFFDKQKRKFSASIRINKKPRKLGSFDTAQEASEAYETKAKELFGKFYKEIP